MSSAPTSQLSVGLSNFGFPASSPAFGAFRMEPSVLTSVRSRTKAERTPRPTQMLQDVAHVAIRLKPPMSSGDSNSFLQYSIEPGGLGSPRLGRRRGSAVLGEDASSFSKNVPVDDTCNVNGNESGNQNDVSGSLNNSCSIVDNATNARGAMGRSSARRVSHSPRAGVAGGNKILTLLSPVTDGTMIAQHMYEFADVFSPTMTDDQVGESIVPGIVEQLRSGYNACVLCYGQTGSGKTHMINALTPAFLHAVFELDKGDNIVEISYIQIYNNNAYDLLAVERSDHGLLLQKPKGSLVCEPRYLVQEVADAKARIAEVQRRRFVGCHALNAHSSRSHVLLSLHITKCVDGVPSTTRRLTLGDLAGSERVKKTGVAGDGLGEAIAINKSLSVLHAVIRATAEDANVLPVRESILTLYLSSTLTNCYLLLIATVSLDKQSYSETKNSLDFATTAKRCVVKKTKTRPRDLLTTVVCSFEETFTNLLREFESLRHRLSALQAEVNNEKQHLSPIQQTQNVITMDFVLPLEVTATTNTEKPKTDTKTHANRFCTIMPEEGSQEDAKMREHILALGHQCAFLQEALCDYEKELISLKICGDLNGGVNQGTEQCPEKCEKVQQTFEEGALVLGTSDLLYKLTDTFMWMQKQLDTLTQQKQVVMESLEAARNEQQQTLVDLLEARKQLLQAKEHYEGTRCQMEDVTAENARLKAQLDELNLKLLCEYTERAIREDTMAWFKASGERAEECERLTAALKEQQNLSGVLQRRLTSTEQELDRSSIKQGSLTQEMRKKDEAFRTIWLLLTPEQKARFMSIGYGSDATNSSGSSSLHQGHENVLLRSLVRALKRQIEEESMRVRDRDYRIEDLEEENHLLLNRLHTREDEYNRLLSLDKDYRNEREQMEQQIAHLYTYIEEHNEKERVFEGELRKARTEWEKLDEERLSAQRELSDLTVKLEKAMSETRAQEAEKEKLREHIRDIQQRDLMPMSLQNQLTAKQRSTDVVSHRLKLPKQKRDQRVLDPLAHSLQGDLVAPKTMYRDLEAIHRGKVDRIHPAQTIRGVSHSPASQTTHPQEYKLEVPEKIRARKNSLVSLDGITKKPQNTNNVGLDYHVGCLRRQVFSRHGSHEKLQRSSFVRANTFTVGLLAQNIDKTLRWNLYCGA